MRQHGGAHGHPPPPSTSSTSSNTDRSRRNKKRSRTSLLASCDHDDPAPPQSDSSTVAPPQTPPVRNQASHSPPPPLQGDDSSNCGKPSIMPQKHMLQLVIDILQRRDTYEIFAEPVDPNEVEDYYRIIKEPMDFGTMRAKLHEGMYDNLEQFQHDVFLITRNAMHFNSSATIYFRQARAIHDLAIRVFHVLGTDPENFEVEFSGTRRRSTRRAHNEANSDRLTKHVKASSVATNFHSKGTASSLDTSLVAKPDRRKPLVTSSTTFHTNRNGCGFFSGAIVGRRSNYVETDHRSTYIPQSDKKKFGSECVHSKPLVLISHQGTNYRESLLLFVKDLGPIAHMFAAQKIQGLLESSSTCQTVGSTDWGIQATAQCQTPAACGSGLREPHHWNSVYTSEPHRFSGLLNGCCCSVLRTTADTIIDRSKGEGGEEDAGKKRKSCTEGASVSDHGAKTVGCTGEANVVSANGRGEVILDGNSSTESWLGSCSCDASVGGVGAGDLNNSCIVSNKNKSGKLSMVTGPDTAGGGGKLDESVLRPVVLALEHSHGIVTSELKSRNRKCCTAAADDWGSQSQSKASSNHMNSTWGRCHEATGGLVTAMKVLQPLDLSEKKKKKNTTMEGPPATLSDQPFTFNMCFLKAQLNQMKIPGAAERNKQGGQRHDDDDDDDAELQLI